MTNPSGLFATGLAVGILLVAINSASAVIDGRQRLLLTRHVLLEDLALVSLGFIIATLGRTLVGRLQRRRL